MEQAKLCDYFYKLQMEHGADWFAITKPETWDPMVDKHGEATVSGEGIWIKWRGETEPATTLEKMTEEDARMIRIKHPPEFAWKDDPEHTIVRAACLAATTEALAEAAGAGGLQFFELNRIATRRISRTAEGGTDLRLPRTRGNQGSRVGKRQDGEKGARAPRIPREARRHSQSTSAGRDRQEPPQDRRCGRASEEERRDVQDRRCARALRGAAARSLPRSRAGSGGARAVPPDQQTDRDPGVTRRNGGQVRENGNPDPIRKFFDQIGDPKRGQMLVPVAPPGRTRRRGHFRFILIRG